jgi:hypothetical protein
MLLLPHSHALTYDHAGRIEVKNVYRRSTRMLRTRIRAQHRYTMLTCCTRYLRADRLCRSLWRPVFVRIQSGIEYTPDTFHGE